MDNSNSNSKSEDVFPLVFDGSAVTEGIHEEEASVDDCEDQSEDQEDKAEGEEDDEDADEDLGVSDQQDVLEETLETESSGAAKMRILLHRRFSSFCTFGARD